MSNDTQKHLVELSDAFAQHVGLTHWRVSFLVRGDGQFFKRLSEGKGCTLRTASNVFNWFSENWPRDLEWPRHIPRPPKPNKRNAA